MEKWKILVIVALLASLPIFGYFQNRPADNSSPSGTPTPEAPPLIKEWIGKTPPSWDMPAEYWVNTKKPIKLEDLRGSVALVEFWRAECPHCEEAAPFMEGLLEKYGSKGLKIVSFQSPNWKNQTTMEHKWADVKLRVQKWGIKYPVAFDQQGLLFQKYKGEKWPTFVVLDKEGVVRHADPGYTPEKANELIKAIEKELGIASAPAKK